MGDHTEGDPVRTSWFGMDKPRPELPVYLRPGKRLKGLDEFEPPEFLGRVPQVPRIKQLPRVRRRNKICWYAMVAGAVALGAALGLALF